MNRLVFLICFSGAAAAQTGHEVREPEKLPMRNGYTFSDSGASQTLAFEQGIGDRFSIQFGSAMADERNELVDRFDLALSGEIGEHEVAR